MKTTPADAPVHPKTLVEQTTDFTAEGSPPPGKVVGSVPPVTPDAVPDIKPKKRRSPTKTTARAAEKGTTPPPPKGPARSSKYG